MITLGNKQICEYCLSENGGEPCRFCGFDKARYRNDWGVLPPGSVLSGKYIIGKIIGHGGFGITYLAFDIMRGKKIALKEYFPITFAVRDKDGITVTVTNSGDADIYKNGMEKFYEEASFVAKFSGNPNIVSVFEFFYENNTAYFTMELLQGLSLKAYIEKKGCLAPEQALYIADRISSALMATHRANILHRDISPDNIMLCEDGNIKLIDFGAARQVMADNPKSMSVILKQGFAPLEQYQRHGKQGPWTDLYSLGATLYYAVTGSCLDDPMTRLDNDDGLQSNSFEIEPQLWEVIRRSLELKIDDRYSDAIEFRSDLNRIAYDPQEIKIELPELSPEPMPAPVMAGSMPLSQEPPMQYAARTQNEPAVPSTKYVAQTPAEPPYTTDQKEKKLSNKALYAIIFGALGLVVLIEIIVIIFMFGGSN